jgi:hypothetical protein
MCEKVHLGEKENDKVKVSGKGEMEKWETRREGNWKPQIKLILFFILFFYEINVVGSRGFGWWPNPNQQMRIFFFCHSTNFFCAPYKSPLFK